ncbi:MAG: hypothetical protein O7C73_04300 [Nitrospirae bacterium]|nr:hypothetical protein [Nitrospirota bacterium]
MTTWPIVVYDFASWLEIKSDLDSQTRAEIPGRCPACSPEFFNVDDVDHGQLGVESFGDSLQQVD